MYLFLARNVLLDISYERVHVSPRINMRGFLDFK